MPPHPRDVPYRLDPKPLGLGGCAKVTRGQHRKDGHVAAVKQAFDHPLFVARLEREIRVQAQIRHPNVMPVMEHSRGFYWYAMPLASTDLSDFRATEGLSSETLVDVLIEAWDGLQAAHALGHVHRDVTPRNILRVDERWVISDFGLVTKGDRVSLESLTRTGVVLGTTGFIAPEVLADPRAASPQSDAYSLGVIASWALTGHWPAHGMLLPLPPQEDWGEFVRLATESEPVKRRDATDWLLTRQRQGQEAQWFRDRNACFNCGGLEFVGPSDQCIVCGSINVGGY